MGQAVFEAAPDCQYVIRSPPIKYPRSVAFLEALPMSATGKLLKEELRNVN